MTTYEIMKEVIHERRSVRRYEDRQVTAEDVKELIDCARYAPSDTNSQTWEFIAILNREWIARIEQLTWDALHKRAEQAEAQGLAKEARLLVKSFGPYATAFSNAPALIICLASPYTSKFRERIFDPIGLVPSTVWDEEGIKSSCLAIQNLMLAAHARGLASCPMTGPVLLADQQIKDMLDIPEDRQVNMVLALGYPSDTPAKLPRKPVEDILRIIE
ncbi:nitroreductase family protein [Paenibacillus apiarius]|uniref:Nitroreductase family protein n=1 Tax=Paenibacillus apiarius TaxID=46240 RepID=A0ABT4DWZ3_9BACL|nr:nitroreductase family protein [Paenibacillus apiarius]MCY9515418.1 nitroreductase family protein [Paenibacillus apiarius]MCY9521874.1 nitroreductase family protein [Paenibacillus apiarius]MCY9550267.1 nitroreductase family protein [Paenibacillus apiarius]MCY9559543.1 nitroreductase family protein [Paenibacillus apiarius]MCY9686839.1 nitroreductase family protein [Paenibacillus apiarius]